MSWLFFPFFLYQNEIEIRSTSQSAIRGLKIVVGDRKNGADGKTLIYKGDRKDSAGLRGKEEVGGRGRDKEVERQEQDDTEGYS